MKNSLDRHQGTDRSDGTIALCPHQGCAYRCCQFQQGEYIVLYPGERDAAIANGVSVGHLQITQAYNGGFKAICTARDTASCDRGYKPMDCKSYPYFPVIEDGEIRAGLKGQKCPLTPALTREHARYVEREWRRIADETPEVVSWLSGVELVGYEDV